MPPQGISAVSTAARSAPLAWAAGQPLELGGRSSMPAELTFEVSGLNASGQLAVELDGAPIAVRVAPADDAGWRAVSGIEVPAGEHTVAITVDEAVELRELALGSHALDRALVEAAARASLGEVSDELRDGELGDGLDYFTSFEATGSFYFLTYIPWIYAPRFVWGAPVKQRSDEALSGTYSAYLYEDLFATGYISTQTLTIPANSACVTIGGWIYVGSSVVQIDVNIAVDGVDHLTTWTFSNADVGAWVYRRSTLPLTSANASCSGRIQLRSSGTVSINRFWLDDFGVDFEPAVSPELQELVFGDIGGNLYGIDAATGDQRWLYASGGGMVGGAPSVAEAIAYFGTTGAVSRLTAVDCRRGQMAWSLQVPAGICGQPLLYGSSVIAAMSDGYVRAYDSATGSPNWSLAFMTVPPGTRVPVNGTFLSGSLLLLSTDAGVACVDVARHALLWRVLPTLRFPYPGAVAGGLFYCGCADHNVYALDLQTGDTSWTYQTGDVVYSQPQYVGGTLMFGSDDGTLYGVNAGTGSPQWTLAFPGQAVRSFVFDAGHLYVAGNAIAGTLYAYKLQISNGQWGWSQAWTFALTNGAQADPAVRGDLVYVTGSDSRVHALRRSDGWAAWTYQPTRIAFAGPGVVVPPPAIDTSRRFDRCCWLGTHNAYASYADGWWYAQQTASIPAQLDAGVRMLMVDIWSCSNQVVYAHGGCNAAYLICPFTPWKLWQDSLAEIRDWLRRNPREIVTMVLEQRVGSATAIQAVIAASGIADLIFWADRVNVGPNGSWNVATQGWPSLAWMLAAGKRFVIFSDWGRGSPYSGNDGLPFVWQWAVENDYGNASRDGRCNNRAESQSIDRNPPALFILNCNSTLSLNLKPDPDLPWTLFDELNDCATVMGIVDGCLGLHGNRLPNFVAVDFFDFGGNGGPRRAVDEINQRWALRAQQELEA
jgi:outer membrane protein assembly factor BamB